MAQIAPPPFRPPESAGSVQGVQASQAVLASAQLQRRIAELPTLGIATIVASALAIVLQVVQINFDLSASFPLSISLTPDVFISTPWPYVSDSFSGWVTWIFDYLASGDELNPFYHASQFGMIAENVLRLAIPIVFTVAAVTAREKGSQTFTLPTLLMVIYMAACLAGYLLWSIYVLMEVGFDFAYIDLFANMAISLICIALMLLGLSAMLFYIKRPHAEQKNIGFLLVCLFAIEIVLYTLFMRDLEYLTISLSFFVSQIALWVVMACAARSAATCKAQQDAVQLAQGAFTSHM